MLGVPCTSDVDLNEEFWRWLLKCCGKQAQILVQVFDVGMWKNLGWRVWWFYETMGVTEVIIGGVG